MTKDFGRFFEVHPRETHEFALEEAGGFLYAICLDCEVMQTVDDLDAGLPVAPAKAGV